MAEEKKKAIQLFKKTVRKVTSSKITARFVSGVTNIAGGIEVYKSYQVARNSSLPIGQRITAAGRFSCCAAAMGFAAGAQVADKFKLVRARYYLRICCGLSTGIYMAAFEGDTATGVAINALANRTMST